MNIPARDSRMWALGDRRRGHSIQFLRDGRSIEIASGTRVSRACGWTWKNEVLSGSLNPLLSDPKFQLCIRWNRAELACSAMVRDFQNREWAWGRFHGLG